MPPKLKEEAIKNSKFISMLREKHETGKWWCQPPLTERQNENNENQITINFPDPAKHWIGFVWVTEDINENHKKNNSLLKDSNEHLSSPNSNSKSNDKRKIKFSTNKVPSPLRKAVVEKPAGKRSSLKKDKHHKQQKPSPSNITIKDRETIAEKLQKAINIAKFPSSKQSPSWLEHEFFKPEVGIVKKKYEIPKLKSNKYDALKIKELGRTQPMSNEN